MSHYNKFNKEIKKYFSVFQSHINPNNFAQKQLFEFYNNNGNLKSIDEIMDLTDNPLLPYIVSSVDFIQSINNKYLSVEQIDFVYNNIKYVIDEHNNKKTEVLIVKEKLQPRFEGFIEYTKISDRTSKSLEINNYDEIYRYLETVVSNFEMYKMPDKKTK